MTVHSRFGSRWEGLFDIVAVITAVAAVVISFHVGGVDRIAALTATVVSAALVAIRRRFPIAAAVGAIAASLIVFVAPDGALGVWVLAEICLFSVPLRRSRTATTIVATIHAAVLYAGAMIAFCVGPADPFALILPVWTGAVVALGSAVRAYRDYAQAVEERLSAVTAAKETELRRRMSEERVRIARDLHDSVANSLAVIALHSTDAERHVEDDPARARRALRTVRTVSAGTLQELAAILAVLRDARSDEVENRTVAATSGIPTLIEMMQASGASVEVSLDALDGAGLSTSGEAALYRALQEGLTNAHRYGSGPTHVTASATPTSVVLTIENAIQHRYLCADSGFGLIGMRERVELAGGSLDVREDRHSFGLRVELPRASHGAER